MTMLDPGAREAARLWAIEAASDGGIPGDDYIDGILTAYLSTVTPAEVAGMVERLRYAENVAINDSHAAQTELSSTPAADNEYADNRAKLCAAVEETISLIQSQAARIAELEARLRPVAQRCDEAVRPDDSDNDGVTVKTKYLRAARRALTGGQEDGQ